jgi:hypothetical protein
VPKTLTLEEGTIDFWIKPSWNGNDNLNHTILSFGYSGGILIAKDGANNPRMMLNRLGYYSGGEIDGQQILDPGYQDSGITLHLPEQLFKKTSYLCRWADKE